MSALKNIVQLIGNVVNATEIKIPESGKKVANYSIATNKFYRNSNGEKVQNTQWHNIVAWDKIAEIVEYFIKKTTTKSKHRKGNLSRYRPKTMVAGL